MAEILDSGARRQFASGGVRDISDDKGDMSLLPFDIVSKLGKFYDRGFDDTKFDIRFVMDCIDGYTKYNNDEFIYTLLACFIHTFYNNLETGIIEYSRLLQKGQIKYNRMNWNKGLPTHCFLDSGLRHCMKVLRGDTDEDHKQAFIWNFVGLLWTKAHHPDLDDIYYGEEYSGEKIDEYNDKWGFNKKGLNEKVEEPEKIIPSTNDIVDSVDMTEEEINNELQDIDIEPDDILTNSISDRIESEAVKNEIAMFVFKIFYEEINKEEPNRVSKMVGQMANKMYSESYKLYILEKDAEEPIIMDIPSDSIGFYNNDGFAEIHVLLDFQDKNMAKVIDLVNDSAQLRIFIGCRVVAEIAGEKDYVGYEFPIGEHYFTMTYPLEASPKYKAPAEENTGISLEPVESDDEVNNNDGSISMEAIESDNDETDGGEERFSEEDNAEENFEKSDVDKKED